MSKRVRIAVGLLFSLSSVLPCASLASPLLAGEARGTGAPVAGIDAAQPPQTTVGASPHAAFLQMPLYFIENRGQADERVAYYVQGKDKTLYFTAQGVTFVLAGEGRRQAENAPYDRGLDLRPPRRGTDAAGWVVKLDFVGANPDVQPVGQDQTGAVISYFKGRPEEWKTGLQTYSRVVYRDLWPGIDLEYSGTVNQLKYQFVVHPGADPAQIRMAYRGADVTINEAGQLAVSTLASGFHDGTPYAYQETDGQRVEVQAPYELQASPASPGVYGFRVGDYDDSQVLVLDPVVFIYCGYIGGVGWDAAYGVAVDSAGNAYVTGHTASPETTFPVSVGPGLTYEGSWDAFVAKVMSDGTALAYCGYIGGSGQDEGSAIAVDADGNAYLTGDAESSAADGFPVTVGPDLTYNGGYYDAFVAKVISDGTGLGYCGYIGGATLDDGRGIAVDATGNAYVTGETWSTEATFPDGDGFGTLPGFDQTHGGEGDAFVAKVISDGTALDYCGYIGGSQYDSCYGIALDGDCNAYITGWTHSSESQGFPVAVGPDLTYNGGDDAFVAKVISDGTALGYCGYIGGSQDDSGDAIALDADGNAYLAGDAASSAADGFPVTVGPDLTYNGYRDGFVAKVISDGTALDYCGYIGGSQYDSCSGIALDGDCNAYITGSTDSSESQGFPVAVGPDLTYNGLEDGFVARVKRGGTGLEYCGYIGGTADDWANAIAVDGTGSAYVVGETMSAETTQGFPVTDGPDLTYNGNEEAFVAKVAPPVNLAPAVGAVIPAAGSGSAGVQTAFITSWREEPIGPAPLQDYWEELKQCYFHVGASPALPGNVTLMYNVQKNKLWMLNDSGTAWTGGCEPGSANILENGQAQVDCALTGVHGYGQRLMVAWAITFKPGFTGTKKTYLKCTDRLGAKSQGQRIGSWTIE
jgi:hypothetical protein